MVRINEELVVVARWSCLFMFSFGLGYQPSHSDQCSALLQFRQDFFTYNLTSKIASWNSEMDCCSWDAVTCDNTTGNVIGLDLNGDSLHGEIKSNSSLFSLVHLQILNLAQNSLYTEIPSGIGNLTSLTHINLSSLFLKGQIPKEISLLKDLVSLDISGPYSRLKLENPNLRTMVKNFARLRELHLNYVNMSADVNSDWCEAVCSSLPELQVLSLSDSKLSGPITPSILNLPFLTHLYLDRTCISELPREIFEHPNLRVFDMSFSYATSGVYLSEFPQNTPLQHLLLHHTNLLGNLPNSICNLKSLTKLDLSYSNLSGPVPSTLGNLTQLVFLDMSNNKLIGNIQFSFEHFDQIEYLDLSVNHLSGPVPTLKPFSQTLKFIDLSNNQFTGPIPSSYSRGLPNLRKLNLQNNSLSGEIPSSLFTLPSLEELYLNENHFNAELQEFFGAATSSLTYVDLSTNKLQGSIPSFLFKIPNLVSLNLLSNNFSGTLDPALFENLTSLRDLTLSRNTFLSVKSSVTILPMPDLRKVYFSYCNISEIPQFLRNLGNLRHLDLSMNRIKGQIPKWIWINSLEYLNLSHNLLSDFERPLPNLSSSMMITLDLHNNSIQASLPFLPPSLSFLSVSNNKIMEEISPSICNMIGLTGLDLSNNLMTGILPPCLADLSITLSVLDVRGNNFRGTVPNFGTKFGTKCMLEVLNLNNNQLEGEVPVSLANCTKLKVLDLGNNRINGTFPSWLEIITELQVLVLRSNRFQGILEDPTISTPFPKLHIIDLSNNSFSGNLPSRYFQNWNAMMTAEGDDNQLDRLGNEYYRYSLLLTNKGQELHYIAAIISILNVVDLSSNKFEGEIPESIGNLKALIVLNLSRNALTGDIQSAMGNLSELQSLDLSQNRLSGKIPTELTSLTFLSALNLSWNFLVGKIPSGTQFNTFSASSYEGNAALCGLPLPKCQQDYTPPPNQSIFYAQTEDGIRWIIIFMGYSSGLVIGIVIERFTLWRNMFA